MFAVGPRHHGAYGEMIREPARRRRRARDLAARRFAACTGPWRAKLCVDARAAISGGASSSTRPSHRVIKLQQLTALEADDRRGGWSGSGTWSRNAYVPWRRSTITANGAAERRVPSERRELAGDMEIFVRAMTAQVALTEEPRILTLEHPPSAAQTSDRHPAARALSRDLAHAEALAPRRRRACGDFAKAARTKRDWDSGWPSDTPTRGPSRRPSGGGGYQLEEVSENQSRTTPRPCFTTTTVRL